MANPFKKLVNPVDGMRMQSNIAQIQSIEPRWENLAKSIMKESQRSELGGSRYPWPDPKPLLVRWPDSLTLTVAETNDSKTGQAKLSAAAKILSARGRGR